MVDSVKLALKSKPKLYAGFHNRNTLVNTSTVKLYGLAAGLDFNNKLKLYAGYYFFNSNQRETILNSREFNYDTVYRDIRLSYFSLGTEYMFYDHGRLSAGWPAQIGIGKMNIGYQARANILDQRSSIVIPLESGVNGYFRIVNWLVLKAGVGYRITIGNKEAFAFSSPYYNFGLAVELGTLFDEIQEAIE